MGGGLFMGFLQDLLPIFKKHRLDFKEMRREVGDMATFTFKPQEKIEWKSGQHGIFYIDHVKFKKSSRAFSIASTPDEEELMISMRIGENPSEYKKILTEMKAGTGVTMRGPIGPFYISDSKPVLFIAGGIGITPYRALLKDCIDNPNKMPSKIELLYLDSKEEYIYKDELEEINKHPLINIKFLNNREELINGIKYFTENHSNVASYFVCGSSTMTNSIKGLLKEQGIKKKNIKSDVFIGY